MSEMDINEVKALIKSLVVSSTVQYSVPRLLDDFKEETGVVMPIFDFENPKAFLRSLTDTIQFVGSAPHEKIIAVESVKSKHISSLVQRQQHSRRRRNVNLYPDYLFYKKFDREKSKMSRKMKRKETVSEVNDKNGEISNPVVPQTSNEVTPDLNSSLSSITNEIENISAISSQTSISISSSSVTDGVKKKLQKLMKKQTQGIWCCDLPDLYKDLYEVPLEFKELGYKSLINMVIELTDIFRCVRPGNGDWLLFDASKPPSQEELDMEAISQCKVPEHVEKNLLTLLESHCEKDSEPGIYLDDILVFYYRKFRRRLNFAELGFPNVKSLLSKLDGQILRLVKDGHRFLIKPIFETSVVNQEIAILPITPEDDVFTELFPDDVVKPDEKFSSLEIKKYFSIDGKIEVNIADILSPQKFYVQLKEFENDFLKLNSDMQTFYMRNLNKYKMPNATIRPNQICAGLYDSGCGFHEWLRSVIIEVIDKNKVLLKFVDYGKQEILGTDKLRFLHRDFLNLPSQSFAAKLSNIEPVMKDFWPLEVSRKFLALVMIPVAEFLVKTIDFENEVISGVIISTHGKERVNVGDALVESGMAVNEAAGESIIPSGSNKTMSRGKTSCYTEDIEERKSNEGGPYCAEPNMTNPESERSSSANTGEIYSKKKVSSDDFSEEGKLTSKVTVDAVEELFTCNGDSALKNYLSLNGNTAQGGAPPLHQEIKSYATAFWLMRTNEFVRMVARTNLDNGLLVALKLAQKMSEITGVAFLNWK